MDDLTRLLYQFVLENRMNHLPRNQEYSQFTESILAQIDQIDSYLTKDQRRELHQLLDTITMQNGIELEQMFQASLNLARELRALTI